MTMMLVNKDSYRVPGTVLSVFSAIHSTPACLWLTEVKELGTVPLTQQLLCTWYFLGLSLIPLKTLKGRWAHYSTSLCLRFLASEVVTIKLYLTLWKL